jgi:hypothetical protein
MQYRDSSIATHYQRGVIAGVDSSNAVRIESGALGGSIDVVGDSATIDLYINAKGTGDLNLGSSGQGLYLAGSTVRFGGFLKVTDTGVATPNFATTNAMVMETTHTITGLPALTAGATTNAFIQAMGHNLSTDCALVGCYVGSTAGQAHCRFVKVSTLTVGASTATITFLVHRA